MVHPGGRPREWDREKIKYLFLEWAQLPNSINLNAFCALPEIMVSPKKLLSFVSEDEEFQELYALGKAMISARREEAVCEKVLAEMCYNRSARYYDYFENSHWKKEKEFESNLRKAEDASKPSEITIKVKNDGLGAGIKFST